MCMDAREFESEILPLYRQMFAVAMSVTGHRDDAADAVQNAMASLWRMRRTLSTVDSPKAYAMATLRRAAIDIVRSRKPTEEVTDHLTTGLDVVDIDESALIGRIIDTLPPAQQIAIRLTAFDGRSIDEVAELMGITLVNVRQLLSRGRRRVRALYLKLTS